MQSEERGMWSVQSQRVTVTVKFWGRRDGLLNRFANSTIYSLQSLVFGLRWRCAVFSSAALLSFSLCLFYACLCSCPPLPLSLFFIHSLLLLPLFLPFALPLSLLFFWPLYAVEMMTRAIKISGDFTCVLVHKADTHTLSHTHTVAFKAGMTSLYAESAHCRFCPNLKPFAAIHNAKLKAKNNMLSVRFIQGELWIYEYIAHTRVVIENKHTHTHTRVFT